MNPPDYQEYLGDGVYVSLEQGMLRLCTGSHDSNENVVYLETEVWRNLLSYVDALTKEGSAP